MKCTHYISTLVLALILASCTSTRNLPRPEGFDKFLKGAIFRGTDNKSNFHIKGELLAVSTDSVLIMNRINDYSPLRVQTLAKKDLKNVSLRITSITNSPVGIEVWSSLLLPLCLTHGWFAILTLPLNFINLVIISATIPSSFYALSIPEDLSWEQSAKFARFPQGWPQNLQKKDLQ